MKAIVTLFLAAVFAAHSLGREWTNASGRTIQADLVELKGAPGSEVAVLRMAEGETYVGPTKVMNDLGAKLKK